MKTCIKCGEEKEGTSEFFPKKKTSKDGLSGTCRICTSEYLKAYHKANLEKANAVSRAYYMANSEKMNVGEKARYKANPEKKKDASKMRRMDNPERTKAYMKAWREANPEKAYSAENKANIRAWNQANPEKRRQIKQRRMARERSLPSTLTLEQWAEVKRHFNNCCAYCGRELPLAQEHFIPLSRGGEYTTNNIIPSCGSCNSSKHDINFFEWYPRYGHYLKSREQKILSFLNYDRNNNQQLSIL